jgi:hypothetical protein
VCSLDHSDRLRSDANRTDDMFCPRRLSCARTLLMAVLAALASCGSASAQRDQNTATGSAVLPPAGNPAKQDGTPIQKHRAGITSRNDFQTEAEAARHCDGRSVVWVITRERMYFAKQDPEYGTKGKGAYMCEDEAKGDGNHSALH